MPAAMAFVDFMDTEGSRLIETQIGWHDLADTRSTPAAAKRGRTAKR